MTNTTQDPTTPLHTIERLLANHCCMALAGGLMRQEQHLAAILAAVRIADPSNAVLNELAFDFYWSFDPSQFGDQMTIADKIVDYYDSLDHHGTNNRLVFVWPEGSLAPTGIDLYLSVMLLLERLAETFRYEKEGYDWNVNEIASIIGDTFDNRPGGFRHKSNCQLDVMARRAWERMNPPSDD
jgi:hypothetical protein